MRNVTVFFKIFPNLSFSSKMGPFRPVKGRIPETLYYNKASGLSSSFFYFFAQAERTVKKLREVVKPKRKASYEIYVIL